MTDFVPVRRMEMLQEIYVTFASKVAKITTTGAASDKKCDPSGRMPVSVLS